MRLLLLLLAALVLPGCVKRQIDISSVPSGALVRVNDREVGRTPCRIEFDHYGVYDVRLTHPGYESVVGVGRADAPFWDWAGIDLVSELVPMNLVSSTKWEFHLIPDRPGPEALVARAKALQSDLLALETEAPIDRSIERTESTEAKARREADRGVVPTPASVLPAAPAETPEPDRHGADR
jgi:hypothetical protein